MSNKYASPLRPLVVKYGGNALTGGRVDPVLNEIASFQQDGKPICLVHGGGPAIDRELSRRGVVTTRIDGLRVTDAETLEVTEAVLCGTINKRLVRDAVECGIRAAGISGEDGATLVAAPARNRALQFVGEVERSDPSLVLALLHAGFLPIVAPLAISLDGSTSLNVNADAAAAAIAVAVRASALFFVTNVPRVLRDPADPHTGIDELSLDEARRFAGDPACSEGMRPKLEAAIAAAAGGVPAYVCAAAPGCLARALSGEATAVVPNPGRSPWSSNGSTRRPISRP